MTGPPSPTQVELSESPAPSPSAPTPSSSTAPEPSSIAIADASPLAGQGAESPIRAVEEETGGQGGSGGGTESGGLQSDDAAPDDLASSSTPPAVEVSVDAGKEVVQEETAVAVKGQADVAGEAAVENVSPEEDEAPTTAAEPPSTSEAIPATSLSALQDSSLPPAIVHPFPSALPPSSSLLASNSSSTTSTPVLAAAQLPPPTPSGSPAPTKKFASSLSVNKKFLEKAGEKGKPEVKAAITRLATPPIAPPISTTHPRLLTGKISSSPTVSLTTAQTVSGPSGWLKTASAPEGQPRAPLPPQDSVMRGGTYERGRGMGGMGMGGAGRGSAVWGARGPGSREKNIGMPGGDFPTAAEAANAKTMRAAALVEQVQTRDRAVQARAAAAAAANATLLQGLDAFRGVHLDPNASHWDEMGDDNDDFLDTTIEFGDGTQYKIDADAPPPEAPSRSSDYLDEPHPSDLATLEAPLAPGESVDEPSREERFKDDYDRTWSKKPLAAEPAKNLFNERLGKFEPYATGRKGEEERKPTMPAGLRRPSTTDLPPHVASHAHPHPSDVHPRRQSITSPRLAKATLPSQPEPRAWVRDAGPGVRRSSMEHGARRPSIDQGTRRPVIEQGGRQLPPHLAGIAPAQPQRGLDRHEPSRRLSGPLSPTLSHPPSSFSAFPPPAATLLPAKPSHLPPPPIMAAPAVPPPAPVVLAVPAPPPAPVTDLEELHTREMHAAAERAKKRRQEEEQVRAEQVERARKKAHELEEKAKLAAEAAALASKPAAAPAVVIKSPAAATSRLLPTGPSTDRADSWRERPRGPLPPAAVPHPVPTLARHEPTHILARGVPPHLASRAPQEPAPERAPNGRPAFVAAVVMAPTKPAEAAAEPTIRPSLEPRPAPPADERVWRRPDAPIAAPAATRQVPPHLAAELANRLEQRAPRPVETPARPVASMRPPAAEVVDAARLAISTASTDPPAPVVTPPSPTASPRKTLALTGPPKAAAFKVPEMSVLEDLMSRIKGAMGAPSTPKIAGRDVAETVSRSDTSSPSLVPTVKLPAAKPSTAPRQPSTAPVLPATSLPVPDALEVVSKPAATVTEPKGKGRGRTEGKKPVRSPPPFENRDPLPLFESTKVERSQSPPPAWKVYAVRLPAISKPLRPPHPRQVKAFFNVQNPLRVIILTWSPPIPNLATRRLSRDDLLIPKQYRKGVVICPVHITKRRLVHTSVPPSSAPASTTTQADVSLSSPAEDPKRAGGRGLGSQRSWQRGALPQSVPEESCASSSVTPTVVDGGSSVSKASSDSDLAVRSDVAFYSAGSTPREEAVVAPVERADGLFMVTSELNGEVVEMTPRESLAAPGADALAPSLESSSFESTTSTNAAAAPWSTAAPLSLSVLNPTAPSVWSPPSADSPTHARSISLGGAQLENSLQGIADPDDFPSAIPSSLADLKSEDEGSNEGQAAPKRGAKDEARLRAAAPSFSSYNVPETLNPAAPRYPYIRQGPSQFQSAGSPVGYSSQPFIPTSGPPHSVQYGQPHLYPSFSISPQPSYSATPMHQSYSPNLFASLPPSSQPPLFASYRPPPQGITNPALIAQGYGSQMSYGAVGAGGGAFGAVGAGGGGAHGVVGRGGNFARSPSMAPGFLPGYGNGLGQPATYRDGYRMPQADGRAAFGGYPASPIQMSQHQQHQPAHQRYPTQPQPYGGAFSPQLPNAHGPGEIGRGGAGGQGQVQGRHWQ